MKKLYNLVLRTVKRITRRIRVLFTSPSGEQDSTLSDVGQDNECGYDTITFAAAPFGKLAWKGIKKKMGKDFCMQLSGRVTRHIKEIDEHFAEADYGLDPDFYSTEILSELIGGSVHDYFVYRLTKRGYVVGNDNPKGKLLITPKEVNDD